MGEAARWATVVAAVAVLAETWRRAHRQRVSGREERLFRAFNEAPDAIHLPVWLVMQAGSFAAIFVVAAVLDRRDKEPHSAVALVVGVMVWAGVKYVKRYNGRGRPSAHLDAVHVRGPAQTGLGYPSGHAALSLTLALVATEGASVAVQLVAIGVALATAAARMYVGAHLPLDVVGGLAIGVVVGEIAVAGIVGWG